jgi:hypothetical protein
VQKSLKKIAVRLGCVDEKLKNLRTLGLIKFLLEASKNEEKIPTIHGVLNDLQISRGKGKAHGAWVTPTGSLIEDGDKRLLDVIVAINELKKVLESL